MTDPSPVLSQSLRMALARRHLVFVAFCLALVVKSAYPPPEPSWLRGSPSGVEPAQTRSVHP